MAYSGPGSSAWGGASTDAVVGGAVPPVRPSATPASRALRVSASSSSLPSLEETEGAGALLPPLAGEDLHVVHGVGLVHDLHAEEGLDHVLHRREAGRAAVLVHDEGDVLLPFEEALEETGQRERLGDGEHVALDLADRGLRTVFGDGAEDVAAERVAGDVVAVVLVDGEAREPELGVGDLADGRRALKSDHHRARRHHVAGHEFVKAEEALEDLRLARVEDAFLSPDRGEGGELGAADLILFLTARDHLRELL